MSLPKHTPPSFYYGREGASVDYEVQIVVELDKDEPPLRPTRGGAPVVKFAIVKSGGTRVRKSSRTNSKEVGWVAEGSVVCIDQKEWYYNNAPDPERLHPNNGFWRVHIIDSGKKPPLTGWITGKSNVIDPIQPSPFLTVGVPVLVGASDVSTCGLPKGFEGFKFGRFTGKDMTKLKSDSCCLPVGMGHVSLELELNRTVLWKQDDGLCDYAWERGEGVVRRNKSGSRASLGALGASESLRESLDAGGADDGAVDGGGLGKVRRAMSEANRKRRRDNQRRAIYDKLTPPYSSFCSSQLRLRHAPSELHVHSPTCTIRGSVTIRNSSKDEILQAKICILREEVITVKKDRKTHRRTNVCRVRSLKWGPILPQSVFTRKLAIPVNFSGNPPSLSGGNLQFHYYASLEADVQSYQKNPITKLGFLLLEGTR